MSDASALVDRIYEAGVISETWPNVLYNLSQQYAGAGGVLFVFGANGSQNWAASPDIRPHLEEFIGSGLGPTNPRPARLAALNYEGFACDFDAFTPEEIDQEKFYTDFLAPRGMGWTAATMVRAPSGDILGFSVDRAFRKGPFEDHELIALDTIRPHLARAALLSARLDLKRAQAMAQALHVVGLPAAVLREGGKLYAANSLFEALIPAAFDDSPGRVILRDKAADLRMGTALALLNSSHMAQASCSIPVRGTQTMSPLIVHLLPIRGAAHDIFSRATALLVVTPVDKQAVPTAEMLQGLFDLTPSESRVAQGVAMAKTIDQIAAIYGLSRETIRSQLYAALGKIGLNRQSELVALLSGKTVGVPGSE
ncbi:MAG: helix-turn-helix transcriptional regulator [Xanthobacteraceae bacterium]|jgi:DNA-binding CsgD family transcriptional regulator